MSKKRGLGRGIGALIPEIEPGALDAKAAIVQIAVENITPNPYQPRKHFTENDINDLAASIKEKGVLQPLLVKQSPRGYQLIAGERRLRAAFKAGLDTVPVVVRDVNEQELSELALIENIQREDLNIIEQAEAYQSLIDRFQYTQEEVARKVGKSRVAVTNALRMLKLGEAIKAAVVDNVISMGHARAYLSLESAEQQEYAHRLVVKKGLSVRQTEALIKKLKTGTLEKKTKPGAARPASTEDAYLVDELRKRFATRVQLVKKGKRGKVIIEFFSEEDLERIFDLLRG